MNVVTQNIWMQAALIHAVQPVHEAHDLRPPRVMRVNLNLQSSCFSAAFAAVIAAETHLHLVLQCDSRVWSSVQSQKPQKLPPARTFCKFAGFCNMAGNSKSLKPLAARIKKMMQTSDDVGKIAQATPVLIGGPEKASPTKVHLTEDCRLEIVLIISLGPTALRPRDLLAPMTWGIATSSSRLWVI